MGAFEDLVAVASPAVWKSPPGPETPAPLQALLTLRNGFTAFGDALVVFPSVDTRWNDPEGWRSAWPELPPELHFFAIDGLCHLHALRGEEVVDFDPHKGSVQPMIDKLEWWAEEVVSDPHLTAGAHLVAKWTVLNGEVPEGHRLVPVIPGAAGGRYDPANLVAVNAERWLTEQAARVGRFTLPRGWSAKVSR